jgi:hypothetical protein
MVWPSKKPRRTSPNWTNNVETGDAKPETVKTAVRASTGLKRGKGLSPIGKNTRGQQHRDWSKELHADFSKLNIHSCEVRHEKCMPTFGLGLAHSRKRRYISSKEQFWEVVLACVKCHEWLDNVLSHKEMEQTVKTIIAIRGTK